MKAVAGKRIVIILVNFFLVLFYFCCGENTTENSTPERVFRFDKFNNGDRYEYEYVSSYYSRSEMDWDFFYRTTGTAVLFIDSIIATKDTIWFSVNYNLISKKFKRADSSYVSTVDTNSFQLYKRAETGANHIFEYKISGHSYDQYFFPENAIFKDSEKSNISMSYAGKSSFLYRKDDHTRGHFYYIRTTGILGYYYDSDLRSFRFTWLYLRKINSDTVILHIP